MATVTARSAAQWNQAGHAQGSLVAGMLELHWYAYAPLRIHHVLLGAAAAWLWHNTPIAAVLRVPTASHKVFHAVLGLVAPLGLVAMSAVWADTFGDYRFTRSLASWVYYNFVTFGSVTCGLLWCYLLMGAAAGWGVFGPVSWWWSRPSPQQLAAVAAARGATDTDQPAVANHECDSRDVISEETRTRIVRPPPSPWSVSWLLTHPSLRWWADRTYWVYIVHLPIVMWLYSSPWLLFPSSPGDQRPATLLKGEPIARTTASFQTARAGPFAAVVEGWGAVRSRYVQPEGTGLRGSTFMLVTAVATLLSFAMAHVLLVYVEQPFVNWVRRRHGSTARWLAWRYTQCVAGLAVFLHLVGTPLLVALQHQVEAALPRLARGA